MVLVAETSRLEGRLARLGAAPRTLPEAEYHFLLGRFIDAATLARASVIAVRWGVHPHEVLIANGWLDAEDYYRALAGVCGTPFTATLPAAHVAPTANSSPRQCLASGLLKERARAGSFILAPDRLRPNALRAMLARLSPHALAIASPHAVRGAICRHFAATFARYAVEGLASRYPDRSARTRPALWQRLCFILSVTAILAAVALAPVATIRAMTLTFALLFVPLIAFRLVAAYGLLREGAARERALFPRQPDHELPIYTILVPLYREAHMLPGLIQALRRLDWPVFRRSYTRQLSRHLSG